MIEQKKPLLQSHDLPTPELEEPQPQEPRAAILTSDMDSSGKINVSDRDLVLRYGSEEEFAELAKAIRKRIQKQSKLTAVQCSKCGWRGQIRGELKPKTSCLYCNSRNEKSGGKLKEMSAGEIEQWRADQKLSREQYEPIRQQRKAAAQMAAQIARDKAAQR